MKFLQRASERGAILLAHFFRGHVERHELATLDQRHARRVDHSTTRRRQSLESRLLPVGEVCPLLAIQQLDVCGLGEDRNGEQRHAPLDQREAIAQPAQSFTERHVVPP